MTTSMQLDTSWRQHNYLGQRGLAMITRSLCKSTWRQRDCLIKALYMASSPFSLVSIEKIYEKGVPVFHHIYERLKVREKYSAARRVI